MKQTVLVMLIATTLLIAACSSTPNKPPTVDGSQREPVNKGLIKDQLGTNRAR